MNDYINKIDKSVVEQFESLTDFLNYDADPNGVYETVHIVPEFPEQKIHVYRVVSDDVDRIKTVIENVKFRVTTFADEPIGEVTSWCFQGGDGETILTFLTALKSERSDATKHLTYYGKNNSNWHDQHNLTNETFILKYETETGRSNEIQIDNVHDNVMSKNASFK